MAKSVTQYQEYVTTALKDNGSYSSALMPNIMALAGTLRCIEIANTEIDALESTTIVVESMHGESLKSHPVFKLYRELCETLRKQMESVGLTWEELSAVIDEDPLVELTRAVGALPARSKTVRPKSGKNR